jgi:hypothetical protein
MQRWVELSAPEYAGCCRVGDARQESNVRRGRRNHNGAEFSRGAEYHRLGASGEYVFAVGSGIPYVPVLDDMAARDVGGWQVRATHWARGHLRIDKWKDDPTHPFALVTGLPPLFYIAGWMWGFEGMQERWWRDMTRVGCPSFWVPYDAIHKEFPANFRTDAFLALGVRLASRTTIDPRSKDRVVAGHYAVYDEAPSALQRRMAPNHQQER